MGTQSRPEKSETTIQNPSYRTPVFEQLEPRLLLSADLTGIDPLAPLETGGDQQAIVVDLPASVPATFAVGATPELGPEQRLTAGGTEIQVPSYSVPVLADWNADGLPDLLVGEKFDTVSGKVRVYLNSGTAAAPIYGAFFYVQAAGSDLTVPAGGCQGAYPRVHDWDQDGRRDLLIGLADGTIRLYLNTGTAANPSFGDSSVIQAGAPGAKVDIDVGDRAAVDVADWNEDGAVDLVVGALDGKIRVYLNRQTAGEPDLDAPIVVQEGSGDLLVPSGRSSVDVHDFNQDGSKDLVVGNTDAQVIFYPNKGTDAAPAFDGYEILVVIAGGSRSRPYIADFNADGVPDVLLGNVDGLVRCFLCSPGVADEGSIGYTTVFENTSSVSNRRAVPVTMQEAGIIDSLTIYHQGGTGHAILAVYQDAGGVPGARLGITDATLISSTEGWQEFALQSPVTVPSDQTIWLAWVFENDPGMRWTDGTPGRALSSATWAGGMPESFGTSSVSRGIYSIYATYTPATGDVTPPGAVTDLTATAGDGQISLSWTNPTDADFAGVQILRKQGAYPTNPTDGTVVYSGTGSTHVDTGLTNGTTYYYAAFSYDEVPNYSSAATVSGTPAASDVDKTVGNTTVFPNVSSVTNRRAVPYVMSEDGSLESLSIYHQGGTGHAILAVYADTGGLPGARLGVTDATAIHSVEGWQRFALQSPVAVSAGQTIWLAWVFENDPGMRWTAGTPGRALSPAAWAGGMPESFGTAATNTGFYSIYATYSTEPDVTAPSNVGDFTATAGDGQITLSWTNPADADLAGVMILRKEGSAPVSSGDGTMVYNGLGTGHVDTGLTNGTTYYYAAFSYDEVPNYSSAAAVSGTPAASSVDKTVGNTTVFPNISGVTNRRAVPYVMSEDGSLESLSIYHQGGTGHAILAVYADTGGLPGARLGVTDATAIHSVEGWQEFALQSPVAVSAGQTIWLAWVFENDPGMRWTAGTPGRALSPAAWGGGMPESFGTATTNTGFYSIYATYRPATGDVTPPGAVTDLTATPGDGQISLSWTNPSDADLAGVKVLRKEGSTPTGPTDGTVVYDGLASSHVDTGLTNGTTYYYAAFSYDEVPNYSSAATVSGTPAASGVDKTVGNTTVFPNVSSVTNRRAVPYVMSEDGSLESLSIYHQGGTGHAILAVYADTGGLPGARLGVTDATAIHSAEGWQRFALQSPVAVSAGQTIWLAWVFENDPGMRWTAGTPGRALSPAAWAGGMPESFGTAATNTGFYSIYATYTTATEVPVEVVVDNSDPTTSSVGVWYPSSRTGSWGPDSMSSIGAGSTFTFTSDLVPGAAYAVYAWWVSGPLRYTTVPYEIRSGGTVLDTVVVNQTLDGSQWNLLGVYTFAETASVTITADPNSANSVNADAVRFVPVALESIEIIGPTVVDEGSVTDYDVLAHYSGGLSSAVQPQTWSVNVAEAAIDATGRLAAGLVGADTPAVISAQYTWNSSTWSDAHDITILDTGVVPVELTVDNLATGASFTGTWHVSGAPNPWEANSMVSWTPGSTYTFTAGPVPGTAYAVYAWWTQSDCRYPAVPYEIRSGGTLLDTVNVDQKANGGQWNLLGVYTFADVASVRISAAPSSAWSTNADAIRFVPVS